MEDIYFVVVSPSEKYADHFDDAVDARIFIFGHIIWTPSIKGVHEESTMS